MGVTRSFKLCAEAAVRSRRALQKSNNPCPPSNQSPQTNVGANRLTSVSFDSKNVVCTWQDGKTQAFSHFWLRDHCRSEKCYHPKTFQRIFPTHKIPLDIVPKSVSKSSKCLHIEWADGHQSSFENNWLRLGLPSRKTLPLANQILWTRPPEPIPDVDYSNVMKSQQGVFQALENLHKYGFTFISNTPLDCTSSLAERIGRPRETHYGRVWKFESDFAHGDLAYTSAEILPHTDTTYFTDPVGYQMLHVVNARGEGGESGLVDGFAAAQKLKASDPEAYNVLKSTPIPTHCAGDEGEFIVPAREFPILNHDHTDKLYQIRFNDNDRSPNWNISTSASFYSALRKWHDFVMNQQHWFSFQLAPSRPVIFDNWRMLHARTEFKGTERQVEGCYWGRDDITSRFHTLLGSTGKQFL